jgi:hypothetical protein
MVLAPVAIVERARVLAVQVAHAVREVGERRLHDEVVVVAEQAAGVHPPAVAALDAGQNLDEERTVAVVEEDRRLVVPLGANVVVGAGCEVAVRSSHGATVAVSDATQRRRISLGTPPLRTLHVPGDGRGRRSQGGRPKETWPGGAGLS